MHHVSCPHTHQQNGSAEKKHRHIVEVALSLLSHATMPLKFWNEAVQAATYLINRVPSRVIQNMSPLEKLYHQKPDYSSLRVFGCACWPNLIPYNKHKLEFRSKHCVFLGFSNMHKGFKCLEVSTGRVYISRDVVFDETIFPFSEPHANAGARLRAEINLLPSDLFSPMRSQGDEPVLNHMINPLPTNLTVENELQDNTTAEPDAENPSGAENHSDLAPGSTSDDAQHGSGGHAPADHSLGDTCPPSPSDAARSRLVVDTRQPATGASSPDAHRLSVQGADVTSPKTTAAQVTAAQAIAAQVVAAQPMMAVVATAQRRQVSCRSKIGRAQGRKAVFARKRYTLMVLLDTKILGLLNLVNLQLI